MHLYHLTGHAFCPGSQLEPQPDGYCHWPESQGMEAILERYRPPHCLPRKESVFFMKERDSASDFGAHHDRMILLCEVDDAAEAQRSDINWLQELDQGFEDPADLDLEEAEMAWLAQGYWSGAPRPGQTPLYEYRATGGLVLECRRRRAPQRHQDDSLQP